MKETKQKQFPKTFREWFDQNLNDYAKDIAEHGADAGFPEITYTSDCAEIFTVYREEIMRSLQEDLEVMGEHDNIMSMVQCFGRRDMAEHWFETGEMDDSTENLLLWFMVEKVAHEKAGE